MCEVQPEVTVIVRIQRVEKVNLSVWAELSTGAYINASVCVCVLCKYRNTHKYMCL